MSDPTEANGTAGAGEVAEPAPPAGAGERRVRVVLVDDHRMFRTGVQAEIGQTAVTGSRSSARPPTSTRPSRSSPRPGPRWCSSTSTSPEAAAWRYSVAAPR